MILNSKRVSRTSEERNAQADMLRRMRREEDERLAQQAAKKP
jgi:hypothetical protein